MTNILLLFCLQSTEGIMLIVEIIKFLKAKMIILHSHLICLAEILIVSQWSKEVDQVATDLEFLILVLNDWKWLANNLLNWSLLDRLCKNKNEIFYIISFTVVCSDIALLTCKIERILLCPAFSLIFASPRLTHSRIRNSPPQPWLLQA